MTEEERNAALDQMLIRARHLGYQVDALYAEATAEDVGAALNIRLRCGYCGQPAIPGEPQVHTQGDCISKPSNLVAVRTGTVHRYSGVPVGLDPVLDENARLFAELIAADRVIAEAASEETRPARERQRRRAYRNRHLAGIAGLLGFLGLALVTLSAGHIALGLGLVVLAWIAPWLLATG